MSTDKSLHHHHAHHFRDGEHEFDTAKHGVWLFLVTEIMMFGGLFVAYVIFRNKHPEIFVEGSQFLDWKMGAINTAVLIFSSFTMALGIHFCQKGQQAKAVLALWTTFACGLIFMVIKYFEYSHKLHLGLKPGMFFNYDQAQSPLLHLYFSFYYLMTGMHGFHVLIGMGLIAWVAIRAMRGEFGPNYYTAVEGVGLFWHLVDLIWIYLFPLLYLMH
jgi:cytochrome c oxidase subunit III